MLPTKIEVVSSPLKSIALRLLQVESQMNMFLTMMEGVDMSSITPSISIDVEPFYDIKVRTERHRSTYYGSSIDTHRAGLVL